MRANEFINEATFGGEQVPGNALEDLKEKYPNLSTLLYFIPGIAQALMVADIASQIQMYNQAIDQIEQKYPPKIIRTVQVQVGDTHEFEPLNEDWNKVNKRDKTDGLSQKAVNAYRRENPGSKLKTAVTTKPSKLKAGSKDAKRRKSFCARMSGNKGPMKDAKGRPTPKAKALSRWNCESVEHMVDMILENMDHDKDNRAVPELKAALLARKAKLQQATDDQVYDIIDGIMTRIAKSHGISGQKLHDMWVDKYDQIPDTWITDEDFDPNGPPPGPEFKPTMPAGTVRVDVSDIYDWYKLGKNISNLKGANPKDFGKGPPSTILSFGDEETEHKYINDLKKLGLTTTDIDPLDPNQPKGMPRQKLDPTYNVSETHDAVMYKKPHMVGKWDKRITFNYPGTLGRQLVSFKKVDGQWVPGHEEAERYLELFLHHLSKMDENFADGKNPQDKGDAKRHGVNTKASVSSLRKTAKEGGRKGQLAHWMANMKAGKQK